MINISAVNFFYVIMNNVITLFNYFWYTIGLFSVKGVIKLHEFEI